MIRKTNIFGETPGSSSDDTDDFATPSLNTNQTNYELDCTHSTRRPRPVLQSKQPTLLTRSQEPRDSSSARVHDETPTTSNAAAARRKQKQPRRKVQPTARKSTSYRTRSDMPPAAIARGPAASSTLVSAQPSGRRRPLSSKYVLQENRFRREVYTLCNSKNFMIPRLPFSRVIREIIQSMTDSVTRITPEALVALQESTEMFLTYQLSDAYLLTIHCGRVTLLPKDFELLRTIRAFSN